MIVHSQHKRSKESTVQHRYYRDPDEDQYRCSDHSNPRPFFYFQSSSYQFLSDTFFRPSL